MSNQSLCSYQPVVSIVDNVVTALSTDVARYFEKPHNDVLKTIRNLINKIGGLGKNYQSSEYINEQNKKQPCYRMDRKGFVLLAMGFTGERALQFKIAYIDAFDEMEARLRTKQEIPYLFEPDTFNDTREKARQYMESLRKNPEQVSQGSIPNDVVAGMIAIQMAGRNFSLHVDYEGKLFVQPMQNPYETLPQAIADPGNIGLEDETIWKIFHACVTTLERRNKNREAWIKARTKS